MLIVNFKGGLGNQMFQYAFYKYLSQNNEVYADLSWFKKNSIDFKRPYMLNHAFGINVNEFKEIKVPTIKLPLIFRVINKSILNNINFKIIKSKENYYIEYPQFKVEYYLSIENGYLDGYWQSEKYFLSIKDQVIKDFQFIVNKQDVIEIAEKIKSTKNSTSLHWRRGDYIGNEVHDVLTPNYFSSSLVYLIENKRISEVFVFTEDYDWVENQLLSFNLNLRYIIISKKLTNTEDYYEMYLMSICENNIISNSSFSWWGAYLNKNINKTVIAPETWFGDENLELFKSEIIPKEWKKFEVNK